eukprot:52574-Lingulodinium_polyedra.AAC.1
MSVRILLREQQSLRARGPRNRVATGSPTPPFPHVCARAFARAVNKSGLRAGGHASHAALRGTATGRLG